MSIACVTAVISTSIALCAGCTRTDHVPRNEPQGTASSTAVDNPLSHARISASHPTTTQSREIPIIYAKESELSEESEERVRRLAMQYQPGEIHQRAWLIYYHEVAFSGRADVLFEPIKSTRRMRKGMMYGLACGEHVKPYAYRPEVYMQVAPKGQLFNDDLNLPRTSVVQSLPVRVHGAIADADVISIVDQIREHASELHRVGDGLIDIPSFDSKPANVDIKFNYESTMGDMMFFDGGPGNYRYHSVGWWVF